jgi:hypothetical protein
MWLKKMYVVILVPCGRLHFICIEGWGSPSRVRNVMEKTRGNNQKVGKTG